MIRLIPFLVLVLVAPAMASDYYQMTMAELKASIGIETNPLERFYLNEEIVERYAAKELGSDDAKEAETSAKLLLKQADQYKSNFNYGNAIHYAHIALGRVDLFNGDLASAKTHLEFAAKTPGSPQLNSFGPNMTLANELLQKGEKESVLKYLDSCAKFWKAEFSKEPLANWKLAIANGKKPDFGSHLK